MFVVDTNVLLYAAEPHFPEHAQCRAQLTAWREGSDAWYTTWGILYEFVRVATHPRIFRRPWSGPSAWSFVDAMLASPRLGILLESDRHAAVTASVLAELPDLAGNVIHDLHTATLMREHGIRVIYTRDVHLLRFPFLEVRDPTA